MDRVLRAALAAFGIVMLLAWSALLVRAPGAALELLLFTSPVVVAVWLIVMLTAPDGRAWANSAPGGPGSRGTSDVAAVRDAVVARDGGVCAYCGAGGATRVAARAAPRRDDPDPLARYVTLCEACAASSAYPALTVPGARPLAPTLDRERSHTDA